MYNDIIYTTYYTRKDSRRYLPHEFCRANDKKVKHVRTIVDIPQ